MVFTRFPVLHGMLTRPAPMRQTHWRRNPEIAAQRIRGPGPRPEGEGSPEDSMVALRRSSLQKKAMGWWESETANHS